MGTTIRSDVEFGLKYKDKITGYIGTCTAIVQHKNSCVRIGLQGPINKDGMPPELQFVDEQDLILYEDDKAKKEIKPQEKKPGGPRPNPTRPKDC